MHIERISIQGFKTYKNLTVIDGITPDLNVVVGKNGSGKSNFFAAIRFLLSDAYTHMSREERQSLLHEGSGTVISAFVEVVFDNSDGRLPFQKRKIAIRRTIGMKKDDYSLDGKSATRSDIMNMLESAGFLRLNPYYIVPQGKISGLTNSKDTDRLALLKDVSGAKVFEAKLKESMREMSSSKLKMQRVEEAMEKLEQKILDLQGELEDLREFQALERQRKAVEYNLLDLELRGIARQLEANEETRETLLANSQSHYSQLEAGEKKCVKLEDSRISVSAALTSLRLERAQDDAEFQNLSELLAAKQNAESELKSSLKEIEDEASQIDADLERLADEIGKLQVELQQKRIELATQTEAEVKFKTEFTETSNSISLLYAKQKRLSKFSSENERNNWLTTEIECLQQRVDSYAAQLENKRTALTELTNFENIRRSELELLITRVESLSTADMEIEINELQENLGDLLEQKKVLLRDNIRLTSNLDTARNGLVMANEKVSRTVSQAQASGLEAVAEITDRLGLHESVHGTLASLFTVSDKYRTAVEVAADTQLLHIVVDDDDTALTIVNELTRQKAGRMSFIPLNRIYAPNVNLPSREEYEYIPVISKLKFREEHRKAIELVFSRCIIAGDLEDGAAIAKKYKLKAVTLDGDIANTSGALTGGHRKFRESRYASLYAQTKRRIEVNNAHAKLRECVASIAKISQEVSNLDENLKLKIRHCELKKNEYEAALREKAQLESQLFDMEKDRASFEQDITDHTLKINSIKLTISSYIEESLSPFRSALSADDLEQLTAGSARAEGLQISWNEATEAKAQVRAEVQQLLDALNHLKSQVFELQSFSESGEKPAILKSLARFERDLTLLREKREAVQKQLQRQDAKIKTLEIELSKLEHSLKVANQLQMDLVKIIEEAAEELEKVHSKIAVLETRKTEVQERIGELGLLPEEAFETNAQTESGLLAKLNEINHNLKRFDHINRKAMEQFYEFNKEKEELLLRKADLALSKESIESLTESLRAQKDAAVAESFRAVAASFSEIFEKLVPAGTGKLVMRSRSSQDTSQAAINVADYEGVSIEVSFNSKEDERQYIEQLSGGQKSLCAIALILAIQKYDPAPFYLFDELDANLDAQYRSAVALVIRELATKAQFICTTFRPELLLVASTFYGVTYSDKVSTIQEIEKDEALAFVESHR